MQQLFGLFAAAASITPTAGLAQQMPGMSGMEHQQHHGGTTKSAPTGRADHACHRREFGPKGETYDLRFNDGMVRYLRAPCAWVRMILI